MTFARSKTIATVSLVALLCLCAEAQTGGQTEEETSLRKILVNQPDYIAVQNFLFDEGFGGFGGTSKVAKLGSRTRDEEEGAIFLREPGKATIKIYPNRKEYAEIPEKKESESEFAFRPEELAGREDVTVRLAGEDKVGRYACRRIEVRYKDERLKELLFVFCAAPELKNLIVAERVFMGPVTMTKVLSDVSLGAREDLFRIPSGYKKITERSPEEQMKDLVDRIEKKNPPSGTR